MLLLYRWPTGPVGANVAEIPTALLGTGQKILVLYNGERRQRIAAEGTPLVVVSGQVRTLAAGETLQF